MIEDQDSGSDIDLTPMPTPPGTIVVNHQGLDAASRNFSLTLACYFIIKYVTRKKNNFLEHLAKKILFFWAREFKG